MQEDGRVKPVIRLLAERLIDLCSEEYYASEPFEDIMEVDIRDL